MTYNYKNIKHFVEIESNNECKLLSKEYDIPLLRIPYWNFNDIENIIGNYLNSLKGGGVYQ